MGWDMTWRWWCSCPNLQGDPVLFCQSEAPVYSCQHPRSHAGQQLQQWTSACSRVRTAFSFHAGQRAHLVTHQGCSCCT